MIIFKDNIELTAEDFLMVLNNFEKDYGQRNDNVNEAILLAKEHMAKGKSKNRKGKQNCQ